MTLKRINKDVVSLTQTAHARQHGVFFRWQSAQGHLPRRVFVKIIGEGATGEIARKSHFGDAPNGGALVGRQSLKSSEHVIGNHSVDRQKRVLLGASALLISVATGDAGVAFIEPYGAACVRHAYFQFQCFAVRLQDRAAHQKIRELSLIRYHSDRAPTPLLGQNIG